jgi:hypothetical protein
MPLIRRSAHSWAHSVHLYTMFVPWTDIAIRVLAQRGQRAPRRRWA